MAKIMYLHNEILEPGQTVIVTNKDWLISDSDDYVDGYAVLKSLNVAERYTHIEVWNVEWSRIRSAQKQSLVFPIPIAIEPIKA